MTTTRWPTQSPQRHTEQSPAWSASGPKPHQPKGLTLSDGVETESVICEQPAPPSRPHVPGEVGLWVFIFGDLMLFSIYFLIFLSRRLHEPEVFAESRSVLHQGLGGFNTFVLLTSSLPVALGVRAVQRRIGAARHGCSSARSCAVWSSGW